MTKTKQQQLDNLCFGGLLDGLVIAAGEVNHIRIETDEHYTLYQARSVKLGGSTHRVWIPAEIEDTEGHVLRCIADAQKQENERFKEQR